MIRNLPSVCDGLREEATHKTENQESGRVAGFSESTRIRKGVRRQTHAIVLIAKFLWAFSCWLRGDLCSLGRLYLLQDLAVFV